MLMFWILHKKKIIISFVLVGIIMLGLSIGLPIHFVNKFKNSYLDRDGTRIFCKKEDISSIDIKYKTKNEPDKSKKTILLTCEKIDGVSVSHSIANAYFYLPFEKKMNLEDYWVGNWYKWDGKYPNNYFIN